MGDLLGCWPHWGWYYVSVALAVSVYQGWRGWHFQLRYGDRQDALAHPLVYRASRCLADAILYAVSTGVGFVAAFLAYRLLRVVPMSSMTPSTVGLLVFLVVVGGWGVTGHLPDVVMKVEALLKAMEKRVGG